jgi:hypothetical protein
MNIKTLSSRSAFFSFLLLGSKTASIVTATNSKNNIRGLAQPDFECNLLIKATKFEDQSEATDLECELNGNGIAPFESLTTKLQDLFANGKIESGNDIVVIPGGSVKNGKVKIPPGIEVSIKKRNENQPNGRRLATTTGNKSTIALWVQGSDASTTTPMDNGLSGCMTDEIFGT